MCGTENPSKAGQVPSAIKKQLHGVRESHRSRSPQDIFLLICEGEGQRRGDYQALKLLALFPLRISGTESTTTWQCVQLGEGSSVLSAWLPLPLSSRTSMYFSFLLHLSVLLK